MAKLLKGKDVIRELRKRLTREIGGLPVVPTLAVFCPKGDGSALSYFRSIERAGKATGVKIIREDFDRTDAETFLRRLKEVSRLEGVHGILVLTPLPEGLSTGDISEVIPPEKDIDGITSKSVARLFAGDEASAPCTPLAVMKIADFYGIELAGKRAVVVGRSLTVGRPLAMLMLHRNATVTICHSKTRNLGDIVREAEVLAVAVGRPSLITPDMVSEGAIVFDIGINVVGGKVVGDVAPEVVGKASAVTPVPGGVGPVTAYVLMEKTVKACKGQVALP